VLNEYVITLMDKRTYVPILSFYKNGFVNLRNVEQGSGYTLIIDTIFLVATRLAIKYLQKIILVN
jgi:hypothetical protein